MQLQDGRLRAAEVEVMMVLAIVTRQQPGLSDVPDRLEGCDGGVQIGLAHQQVDVAGRPQVWLRVEPVAQQQSFEQDGTHAGGVERLERLVEGGALPRLQQPSYGKTTARLLFHLWRNPPARLRQVIPDHPGDALRAGALEELLPVLYFSAEALEAAEILDRKSVV